MSLLNLNTPKNLPPVGKEYMCFQIDGKSILAAKCVKSRIIPKVVDCVLFVDTCEQQCVVLKGMLQSPCIKDYMKNIGIDLSLSNSGLFEHRCLQKTKKFYQHAGNFGNQQQFKDILEAYMLSTPKGSNNNSPRSSVSPPTHNKPSAIKSLCIFTNVLDVKNKAYSRRVGATKSRRKANKSVNM